MNASFPLMIVRVMLHAVTQPAAGTVFVILDLWEMEHIVRAVTSHNPAPGKWIITDIHDITC